MVLVEGKCSMSQHGDMPAKNLIHLRLHYWKFMYKMEKQQFLFYTAQITPGLAESVSHREWEALHYNP